MYFRTNVIRVRVQCVLGLMKFPCLDSSSLSPSLDVSPPACEGILPIFDLESLTLRFHCFFSSTGEHSVLGHGSSFCSGQVSSSETFTEVGRGVN